MNTGRGNSKQALFLKGYGEGEQQLINDPKGSDDRWGRGVCLQSREADESGHIRIAKIVFSQEQKAYKLNLIQEMDYDARKDSLLSEQESQKVEIYFSITKLDASSTYLCVYLQETNRPRKKLMQTKPAASYQHGFDFPESLTLDYMFEVRQKIIVEVYSYNQLLGEAAGTVGEIFNARKLGVTKDIESKGQKVGSMNLRGEKVERGSCKYVQFGVAGRNVDVGSYFFCFGERGCQWKLYKVKGGEEYLLYESQARVGKNNRFNPLKINEKRLCNNNYNQPLIFRFFGDSSHSLIGQARTDLQSLLSGNTILTLRKDNEERGVMAVQGLKQTIKYDFTDYLSNGMQMAMVVCIDFTGSNGVQTLPSSLHHIGYGKRSQYEEALHQVCNIVLDYDTDKLVPTFGFGAKVNMPNFNTGGKVHHCFPINGSESNPNLFQLGGILQGYRAALPFLTFSGPTFFAPLLRQAMGVCAGMRDEVKEYMILLILTDGIIHDKQEVKDLLVKCGRLPLSVIIIGIGNGEDWSAMHELDDDDCQMTDFQGNKTQRDLVQFVEFSQHNNNGVELAREVLQELPRQVEEYHQLIRMTPEAYRKNIAPDVHFQKESDLRNK